jgi:hypothetical protein
VALDFAPVRIFAEPAAPGLLAPVGVTDIEFAEGTRLRITGAVDATVTAAVGAGGEGAAIMMAFPAGVRIWLATGASLTNSRDQCASSNWRCTRTKPG